MVFFKMIFIVLKKITILLWEIIILTQRTPDIGDSCRKKILLAKPPGFYIQKAPEDSGGIGFLGGLIDLYCRKDTMLHVSVMHQKRRNTSHFCYVPKKKRSFVSHHFTKTLKAFKSLIYKLKIISNLLIKLLYLITQSK